MSDESKGKITFINFRAQPHLNQLGVLINLPHPQYLSISLPDIRLIDADRVYPKDAVAILAAKVLQRRGQVFPDVKDVPINQD